MGTRMREQTEFRPKPMVEIGGRPILWHIMKIFAHYDLCEFVLCLGYRGDMIKEYFLNYEAMNNDFTISLKRGHPIQYHGSHEEANFQVTLVDTGPLTMTGGRVKRIERYVDGDTFMVTYGDGVADIDIRKLLAFHRSHGTTGDGDHDAAGLPLRHARRRQRRHSQEIRRKARRRGWANAGFFVFQRRVFDYLEGGEACVMEREPMERLAADGQIGGLPPRAASSTRWTPTANTKR